MKTIRIAAACLIVTIPAYAEPSVSLGHLPILWCIVVLSTAFVGALPVLAKKYAKLKASWRVVGLCSIVLSVLWLVFAGPLIVVFGSIMITGRTM